MSVPEDPDRSGEEIRRTRPSLTLAPCRREDEWDRLLGSGPGSTAFHRFGWLDMQARAHGWLFEPLVVSVRDEPVGVAPLLLTRRGPLLMEARVPFPYVGPVVPEGHLTGTLVALDEWARRHRVASSRVEFAPGRTSPAEAAPAARWEVHRDSTFVVDLSHGSLEQFWQGTRRSVRRTLRSAEQRGVTVQPSTRTEVTTWLPLFFEEAYGARGLPSPYARDIGEAVWDRYGDQEGVCMLSARVRGEPGGLSLAFGHGDTLYSWAGGSLRSRRAENAGTALYVHEIRWALEHGFRRVDEVGAVDEGVSRFKRAFGAQEEHYLVATRTHSPVWRHSRRAYRLVKRGRGRLAAGLSRRHEPDDR